MRNATRATAGASTAGRRRSSIMACCRLESSTWAGRAPGKCERVHKCDFRSFVHPAVCREQTGALGQQQPAANDEVGREPALNAHTSDPVDCLGGMAAGMFLSTIGSVGCWLKTSTALSQIVGAAVDLQLWEKQFSKRLMESCRIGYLSYLYTR
ncbi:hypothetical protein VTG60DRAFT_6310 [Thermothelomyces hinnuleus]